MTKGLSSAFALAYQPLILLIDLDPTSTVDPDRDSSSQNLRPQSPRDDAETYGDIAFRNVFDSPSDESSKALTDDYLISPTDLWNHFNAELANKTKKAWEVHRGYRIRIEALRSDAMLDDFNANGASERDFWSFFKSVPFAGKAELVLLDNGNLRAIWSGEDGSHLGLQFLGDRMLQYVIFRRRKRSSRVSRVAGRDTFEGVKKQVRTFELDALLKS